MNPAHVIVQWLDWLVYLQFFLGVLALGGGYFYGRKEGEQKGYRQGYTDCLDVTVAGNCPICKAGGL